MVRYYLHIKSAGESIGGAEDFEFPDLSAAQTEALEGMREILANAIWSGKEPMGDSITVTDENGHELASVPLVEALPTAVKQHLR